MNDTAKPEIVAEPPAAALHSSAPQGIWIGYLCAALGATLFSTKAIIIKLAYAEAINAETLLALRMALVAPVLRRDRLDLGHGEAADGPRAAEPRGSCCAPPSSACSATGSPATRISSASFTSPRSSSG